MFAAVALALDLTAFFTGRTHAENQLKIVFSSTVPLIVDSVGRIEGKEFVLIDTVHEGDKPVRMRKWVTHEVAPGHYSGTLSDATGPVDILVRGNSATIRYTMNTGLRIEQVMQLQPDGRTLTNHVVARRFGLKFAHVDGTVRKVD
jgi:hypothetical protein